jgi:hypothetical protein
MIEIDGHKYISKISYSKLGALEVYICANCRLFYWNSDYIDPKMKNLTCDEQIIKNIIE